MKKNEKKSAASSRKDNLAARAEKVLAMKDNAERFKLALVTAADIKKRLNEIAAYGTALAKTAAELEGLANNYADAHPAVFDWPRHEMRAGIFEESLVIDGVIYKRVISKSGLKRTDGNAQTQEFLATLPEEWCKTERKLDTSGIKRLGVPDAMLAKYGLFRPEYRTWSAAKAPRTDEAPDPLG